MKFLHTSKFFCLKETFSPESKFSISSDSCCSKPVGRCSMKRKNMITLLSSSYIKSIQWALAPPKLQIKTAWTSDSCTEEGTSYRFGTTWRWVNNDGMCWNPYLCVKIRCLCARVQRQVLKLVSGYRFMLTLKHWFSVLWIITFKMDCYHRTEVKSGKEKSEREKAFYLKRGLYLELNSSVLRSTFETQCAM